MNERAKGERSRMNVEVNMPTDLNMEHRAPVEIAVRESLRAHPFFGMGAVRPDHAVVDLSLELGQGTAIDHSDYERSARVPC